MAMQLLPLLLVGKKKDKMGPRHFFDQREVSELCIWQCS